MYFKPKTSASRKDVGVGDASSDIDNVVRLLLVGLLLVVVGEDVDEVVVAEGLGVNVVVIKDERWIKACRVFVDVAVGRKAIDSCI
jgi:hypothetical protein